MIKYWAPTDEWVPAAPLQVEEYPWSPPLVLPNRSDAFGALVAPFTHSPDWAFYVPAAPLQVEEYPWEKPWILPNRSESFASLIAPFTYAPDAMDEVPNSPFGGPEYSDWEWRPPTVLPVMIAVQNPFTYGDGDDSPQSLTIEDYPWDAMPMRIAQLTAPQFTYGEDLPNFLLTSDDYEWVVRPAPLPQAAQPFSLEEVWGSAPLTVHEEYDVRFFLPPRLIAQTGVPPVALLAMERDEDGNVTPPAPPPLTGTSDFIVIYRRRRRGR